jgi:hypothetical protein
MSPEQAAGKLDDLGPASDVYSLGATLYCLLTGKPPVEERDLATAISKVQSGDIPKPRDIKPEVPLALDAICQRAMALLSKDRYPSPRDLANEIEHWLGDEPVKAYRESIFDRFARSCRRRPFRTGLVGLFIATLATQLVFVAFIFVQLLSEYASSLNGWTTLFIGPLAAGLAATIDMATVGGLVGCLIGVLIGFLNGRLRASVVGGIVFGAKVGAMAGLLVIDAYLAYQLLTRGYWSDVTTSLVPFMVFGSVIGVCVALFLAFALRLSRTRTLTWSIVGGMVYPLGLVAVIFSNDVPWFVHNPTGGEDRRAFSREETVGRSLTLIARGDLASARALAEKLVEQAAYDPGSLVAAARIYALCSQVANEKDNAIGARDAARTMDLLGQAKKRGYLKYEFQLDCDQFTTLRSRADFQRLIAELNARS